MGNLKVVTKQEFKEHMEENFGGYAMQVRLVDYQNGDSARQWLFSGKVAAEIRNSRVNGTVWLIDRSVKEG